MSETQAVYDGDRLPAIKAAYGTWIASLRGGERADPYARTLRDLDWLIADCERQRARNAALVAALRADLADASGVGAPAGAGRGAIRDALFAWHDAHRAWYAATNPHRIATGGPRFDAAHRAMAVAWGRLVRLLDAARPGDDDGVGS